MPRLRISQPAGIWARAGLRTGDVVRSWNGAPVSDVRDLRGKLRPLRIGDTVAVGYDRRGTPGQVVVPIEGYSVHVVRIESVPHASERQVRVRHGTLVD